MTWRAWSARLIVSSERGLGRPVLGDRVRHLAQRRADGVDARRGHAPRAGRWAAAWARTRSAPSRVDDAPIDEPRERVVEGRELLDRETILGVVGVQEVEGVLEIDVVSVASVGRIEGLDVHLDNHSTPVDRLRARGYITQ